MSQITENNAATNAVLCACCKEEKENSTKQFYKKQLKAIKEFGTGVCKSCWDGLDQAGKQRYTEERKLKERRKFTEERTKANAEKRKRQEEEQEGKPKTKKQKKAERRREIQQKEQEQRRKRQEREQLQTKNRDELNRALAAKPRKCANCHKVKAENQFSDLQYGVGNPVGPPFVKDENYGRIPNGLIEYAQQETIVVGKCLECYPREEEQRDIAAEARRQRIKSLHDDLQAQRKAYDEQLEKGEIFYQYPRYLWGSMDEDNFESYSPKDLVGVYDIIYVNSSGPDRSENKTVKNAMLTISHNGKHICGKVEGQLYDGDFKFEGNDNSDFEVVEHEWDGLNLFEETPPPACTVHVFAHRFICRWIDTSFGYSVKSNEGIVPMCGTVEEANAFIAQQKNGIDHSKSWISNHLKLPTDAVSLIHKYAKAWTPPDPFFFFEKGDLRVRVMWEEGDLHFGGDSASEYVARKRAS